MEARKLLEILSVAERLNFSEYLKELREEIRKDTLEKVGERTE